MALHVGENNINPVSYKTACFNHDNVSIITMCQTMLVKFNFREELR